MITIFYIYLLCNRAKFFYLVKSFFKLKRTFNIIILKNYTSVELTVNCFIPDVAWWTRVNIHMPISLWFFLCKRKQRSQFIASVYAYVYGHGVDSVIHPVFAENLAVNGLIN